MTPQTPSKWVPWDLTQFSQSPSAGISYFPESHQLSEISSLSKVLLVWGKARSHRVPNLGCRGAEWFDVSSKNSAWDVMHGQAQSRAAAFWIIWRVSMKTCSSLMQNVMQICCSNLLILNAMATQYTCSLNSIYLPHWLVQWSHCSHKHIPVHSPWLPGYIKCHANCSCIFNNGWTSRQTSYYINVNFPILKLYYGY